MRWMILFALALTMCQKSPKDPCTYFRGTALGKPYHVVIADPLPKGEKRKLERLVKASFSEIEKTFDRTKTRSEIAQFNKASHGKWVVLSPRLYQLLELCQKMCALSGGRFDPTVAPLCRVWKQSLNEKKLPSPKEIEIGCNALGWHHIVLQNGSAKKSCPEVCIDLTQIARGDGIDRIVDTLKEAKVGHVFVSWGGQFKASGKLSDTQDWMVQIHPALQTNGQRLAPIALKNASLATAGDFQSQGWVLPAKLAPDGQAHRYFNIIDPLTAAPLEQTPYSIAAVAVIAPNSALASALATAAMIFPSRKEAENWAQEVVELFPDVSFWILSHNQLNTY
jgi:thiamine biosynthesis lipoprotein